MEYELVVMKFDFEGEMEVEVKGVIMEEFLFVVKKWFVLFYMEVVFNFKEEVKEFIEEVFYEIIEKRFVLFNVE